MEHPTGNFPEGVMESKMTAPAARPFLLRDDPQKFMKLILLDTAEERLDALSSNIDDVILCEIIRYGLFNETEMIGPLAQLYEEQVLPNYSEDRRRDLYRHIVEVVENLKPISVNAFLPFIAEDDSQGIVSTAVIDYVSLGPLTDDDPMSRPKDIIGMIESGGIKNDGAAFGGLLHLGDARLCKLLWPIRNLLDLEEVNVAVKCPTGFLYSASVEFEIDWLEGMEGDLQDGLFGAVASGLALQHRMNTFDAVFTGQRQFPVPKHDSPKDQKRHREMQKPVSIEEYTNRIAPRLYALERTEPPPRVMPHVLTEWELTPVTDPGETVEFDDRHQSPKPPKPITPDVIADDQIAESDEEWFDGEGVIYLSWGILNPNGPTLYCLGLRRINGKWRVFFRWLHMLGGCTYYAAKSDEDEPNYNDIFEGAVSIENYLSERGLPTPFEVIPSFVISNGGDATIKEIAKRLMSTDAASSQDWGREIAYLEAFGHDYFSRAGSEIRLFYETEKTKPIKEGEDRDDLKFLEARYGHIPAFKDAIFPQFESSEMTETLFNQWWETIDTVEHRGSAIPQLAEMWRGAITILPAEMAETAVTFEQVIDFLSAYHFDLSE